MGAAATRERMEELRLRLRMAGDEARADCARFRANRMRDLHDETASIKAEIWRLSEKLAEQIAAERMDGPATGRLL